MFHDSPIETLENEKRSIEKSIEWYKKPNHPGVNFTDAHRKKRISELTGLLTEYNELIKLLTNDRFQAIEADLIRFVCIEANIVCLESMIRKINSKDHPNMRQECLDLIQDIQRKYFGTENKEREIIC